MTSDASTRGPLAVRRAGGGARSADAAFRRAFATIVTVFGVVCLVFLGLTTFQGPKLSSAVIDTELAVQEGGQQLRLFANQRVAQVDAEQVTVTPAAEFSVQTADDVIAITFAGPLHYGTEYTVEVDGVTSQFQDQTSTLRHSFSTGSTHAYVLDRAEPESGQPDQIMRGSLSQGGLGPLESVYSDQRILDFVVVGQAVAVVTEAAPGEHSLSLVSAFDGAVEEIALPHAGTIDELEASPGFGLGFRFTSGGEPLAREFFQTLFWMDLEAVHTPAPVMDIAGEPISVSHWKFVPPGDSVAALGADKSLLLIDPRGVEPVVPLGTWEGLDDVASSGEAAIVRDLYDTIILSLEDGSAEPFGPTPIDGQFPFGGQVELLGSGPERVQKVSVFDAEANVFVSRVVVDDGTQSRQVFASETGKGSIDDISVSPNGQFVAVELVPDVSAAVSDGYYPFARADSIRTVIVDLASGTRVSDVPGFAIAW